MSGSEQCPYPYCQMSGPVQRVLSHVRDVHDSSLLPASFVDRLHLHQCAGCDKWFSKLAQHKSRCPKRQVRSESASHANGSRDAHRTAVTKIIDNVPIQDLSNNWSKIDAESEICQTHPEVPLTSREDQAWSLIRDLSVESLLRGHLPSITRNVSPSLKSLFQDCCDLALTRIVQDPIDEAGWKLFLCIPRMILRHKRGGAAAIRQERPKFLSFLDFQWEELLHLQQPLLKSSSMQSKLSTNRKKFFS